MVSNDIIQMLLAYMSGASLVADNRQILARCPICGDSYNPSSAHLYIGPLKEDGKPLSYDCKKCSAHGVVDTELLRNFDIYDLELVSAILEHNKSIDRAGSVYNYSKAVYTLRYTSITDGPLSELKAKYVNDRLGTNLNYDDIVKRKIVLNLSDIFKQNIIPKFTRHPNIIEQLDKYFIGFISYDNCFLNMRRLCDDGKVYHTIDKRYINYNVFDKMDNSLRFYAIPTQINWLDPKPIHVYITEGPFDILAVKEFVSSKDDNCIHVSAGGKSYLSVIKFIISTLGVVNMVLHLCPDGDVDDYQMYKIAEYLDPFNLPINMIRNGAVGEKDLGVPQSRISLQITDINRM